MPVSQEHILSDLTESHQQISDGKGLDMKDALKKMGNSMDSFEVITYTTGFRIMKILLPIN